jgi:hypothetical protein
MVIDLNQVIYNYFFGVIFYKFISNFKTYQYSWIIPMSLVESAIKLQILKHGMHIFVDFKAIDDNLFMSKDQRWNW